MDGTVRVWTDEGLARKLTNVEVLSLCLVQNKVIIQSSLNIDI